MGFHQRLLLVISLAISAVPATTQASTTLAHMSTLTGKLEANRNAVDSYNGGMVATVPVATTANELCSALKIGNDHLHGFSHFPPEDSKDIVKSLGSFGQADTDSLDAYKRKVSP
jgi:hypothetical protein